jgi:hypothetical protein
MKFEFSFKATPTISCCFPSRPDIEDVILAIIEKSPSQFTSTVDTTDIDWEVRDVLFDELDIEPQDLKVTETNITADISGEKLEFSGYLIFERLDGKTTEIVDLTEAFKKRMIAEFSDNDVLDACFLDFSALDDLLDEDCEDGYYLEVVIQENDVEASTKLTD